MFRSLSSKVNSQYLFQVLLQRNSKVKMTLWLFCIIIFYSALLDLFKFPSCLEYYVLKLPTNRIRTLAFGIGSKRSSNCVTAHCPLFNFFAFLLTRVVIRKRNNMICSSNHADVTLTNTMLRRHNNLPFQ